LLRITKQIAQGVVTLRLEGRLFDAWIDEVRQSLGLETNLKHVRLDLSGMLYADSAGIQLLKSLRRDGAEIVGANPYFSALLELTPRA
jgi:anti-anti-sigma regulatory factor